MDPLSIGKFGIILIIIGGIAAVIGQAHAMSTPLPLFPFNSSYMDNLLKIQKQNMEEGNALSAIGIVIFVLGLLLVAQSVSLSIGNSVPVTPTPNIY